VLERDSRKSGLYCHAPLGDVERRAVDANDVGGCSAFKQRIQHFQTATIARKVKCGLTSTSTHHMTPPPVDTTAAEGALGERAEQRGERGEERERGGGAEAHLVVAFTSMSQSLCASRNRTAVDLPRKAAQ